MKSLITTLILIFMTAGQALAHPGHDHATAPGGENHHLLWYGGFVIALVIAGFTVPQWARQRAKSKRSSK